MTTRRAFLAGALALAATPAAAQKPRDLPLEPQAITVAARPIAAFRVGDPAQRRFGALEWVGGLELTSSFRGFGGLSAIAFTDTGGRRFLAASDAGIWLEGEIVTDGERPVAIRDARMAPMRDERGRSVAGIWRGDAESIAVRGQEVLVGFEQVNVIRRYRLDRGGIAAVPDIFPVTEGIATLRRSRGLESLAVMPPGGPHAGSILAIAESPVRGEPNHRAWIIGPRGGALQVVYRDDYDVTDAAFLPNGDLVLLERRVRLPFGGISCRLLRVEAATVRPGAVLDGRVIFEADLGYAVDNMEGLAVHRGADGGTYLTMVSDDNYSILQRTLLLRFRLVE